MAFNAFRQDGRANGRLDRKYLRVAAVYRLLSRGRIGKARALALLAQRHTPHEMKSLQNTVALWRAWSLRGMAA